MSESDKVMKVRVTYEKLVNAEPREIELSLNKGVLVDFDGTIYEVIDYNSAESKMEDYPIRIDFQAESGLMKRRAKKLCSAPSC